MTSRSKPIPYPPYHGKKLFGRRLSWLCSSHSSVTSLDCSSFTPTSARYSPRSIASLRSTRATFSPVASFSCPSAVSLPVSLIIWISWMCNICLLSRDHRRSAGASEEDVLDECSEDVQLVGIVYPLWMHDRSLFLWSITTTSRHRGCDSVPVLLRLVSTPRHRNQLDCMFWRCGLRVWLCREFRRHSASLLINYFLSGRNHRHHRCIGQQYHRWCGSQTTDPGRLAQTIYHVCSLPFRWWIGLRAIRIRSSPKVGYVQASETRRKNCWNRGRKNENARENRRGRQGDTIEVQGRTFQFYLILF